MRQTVIGPDGRWYRETRNGSRGPWEQLGNAEDRAATPLPTTLPAMTAFLNIGHPARNGPVERLVAISDAVHDHMVPARSRAALLRYLAATEGLINEGTATDRVGRPALVLAVDSDSSRLPTRTRILIDPGDGSVLAVEEELTRDPGALDIKVPAVSATPSSSAVTSLPTDPDSSNTPTWVIHRARRLGARGASGRHTLGRTKGVDVSGQVWWGVAGGVLGVAGGVAGWRFLRAGGHRYADDTRPQRPHIWLPVTAPVLAAVAGWRLADRPWPVPVTVAAAVPLLLLLAAVDIEVHRIPRLLTWPGLTALATLLGVAAAAWGGWSAYARAVEVALVAWVFFLVLHRLSRRALGRGDVTLAGLLGLLLGWFGWSAALVALYAAFLLAGVTAAALLVTRRATRHTRIAFGPSMIAGTLAVLLAQ